MALSGSAALVMFFDVAAEAIDEHDHWHTFEHFPERLSIPGFLRGSRWIAEGAGPRYCVMYEVADIAVLTGAAYRERLDNPTPWTRKMMQSVRGMTRGFCAVRASFGHGLGNALLALRYSAADGREDETSGWLERTVDELCRRPGIASAHLLAPMAQPAMTKEQAIRGQDTQLPQVLLVCAYRAEALTPLMERDSGTALLAASGFAQSTSTLYRLQHSLTDRECA